MHLSEKEFFQFGRRYFVKNSFDGALTILGIILGSMISGIVTPKIVLLVGFSACIGMGVSGLWGTFLTESAERKKKLRGLEQAMLIKLGDTKFSKNQRKQALLLALIDGFSPFLTAIVILSPFVANVLGLMDMQTAYYSALGITAVILFALGVFLGKVSKENVLRSGVIMLFAGLFAGVINLVLFLV